MTSTYEKRLLKLLNKHGYELVETNDFGLRTYRLPDCRDVVLFPKVSPLAARDLTRQITADTRRHDPENTPEAAAKQKAWEEEEAERLKRKADDEALVKDQRLGGLSAVLTELEVDRVANRAEQILAQRRATERLIRNRPTHV